MIPLHFETITPGMHRVLKALMETPKLRHFRLVGGTALALQLGHRISVDLDLFTDQTTDFSNLKNILPAKFPSATFLAQSVHGQTWAIEGVKCDLFDWKVPFSQAPVRVEKLRLASLDDLAAYKLESFSERKSEKDFRDIAEILHHLTFEQVLETFRKRYPFMQTGVVIPPLLSPESVIRDFNIRMLKKESFEKAAARIQKAIKSYEEEIVHKAQNRRQREKRKYLTSSKKRRKSKAT